MCGTFTEYVRCVRVCTVFLCYFVYVNVFLIALSVLSPSDNSIAVSDDSDDDNNNNNKHDQLNLFGLTTATSKLYFPPVKSNHFLNQQRKRQDSQSRRHEICQILLKIKMTH
jgi:hypothetical protein